jgi:16S rRNA processing protein RimM
MKRGGLLAVGRIGRPHGVRGKVRVAPLGGDPRQILALHDVLIGRHPDDLRSHRIVRVQPHKGLFVMELQGVGLKEAEAYAGSFLWAHREALPPLEEKEYYWEDLIGLEVVVSGEGAVGVVEGLLETPGQELLVCRAGGKERLIPFVEDLILEVDPEGGRILIRPMEGLL